MTDEINQYIENMKAKHSVTQTISFPSVTRIKHFGMDFWLAVWLNDNIPQHSLCGTEEEGWRMIDHES